MGAKLKAFVSCCSLILLLGTWAEASQSCFEWLHSQNKKLASGDVRNACDLYNHGALDIKEYLTLTKKGRFAHEEAVVIAKAEKSAERSRHVSYLDLVKNSVYDLPRREVADMAKFSSAEGLDPGLYAESRRKFRRKCPADENCPDKDAGINNHQEALDCARKAAKGEIDSKVYLEARGLHRYPKKQLFINETPSVLVRHEEALEVAKKGTGVDVGCYLKFRRSVPERAVQKVPESHDSAMLNCVQENINQGLASLKPQSNREIRVSQSEVKSVQSFPAMWPAHESDASGSAGAADAQFVRSSE